MSVIPDGTPALSLEPPAAKKNSAPRIRLEFLDGLRGLAALYVVVYHLGMVLLDALREHYPRMPHGVLRGLILIHTTVLNYGHFAVVVFIVLSGFCLTLPLLRSEIPTLNLANFFWRRSRRLLPPYYAAMLLSLGLIALVPGMNNPDEVGILTLPAFTPGAIITHLALVHNLFPAYITKINGPFWSIALEWQIYFVFALLLVPVWRKWGMGAALAAAFIVGLAPNFLVPRNFLLQWPTAWLLSAFGLGMAGAWVSFGQGGTARQTRLRLPWTTLTFGLGLLFVALMAVQRDRYAHTPVLSYFQIYQRDLVYVADILVAAWTTALLVFCTVWLQNNKHPQEAKTKIPLALRIFDAPWAVRLGAFSYSLYLLHSPLLSVIVLACRAWIANPLVAAAFIIIGGVLVPLVVAYCFFLLVERRFLNTPSAQAITKSDVVVASSPIPTA